MQVKLVISWLSFIREFDIFYYDFCSAIVSMVCNIKTFRHYRPHSFPPISTNRDAARRKEKARSLADDNCASDMPIRPVADHSNNNGRASGHSEH